MSSQEQEITKKFIKFVNDLSDNELKAMSESRKNIYYGDGEFYTYRNNGDICVYDSAGQSDIPVAEDELKTQLIDDAEALLQPVFYAD
jgi:hypothetical protein